MKSNRTKKLEFKKVTLVELQKKELDVARGGGTYPITYCISKCICPY